MNNKKDSEIINIWEGAKNTENPISGRNAHPGDVADTAPTVHDIAGNEANLHTEKEDISQTGPSELNNFIVYNHDGPRKSGPNKNRFNNKSDNKQAVNSCRVDKDNKRQTKSNQLFENDMDITYAYDPEEVELLKRQKKNNKGQEKDDSIDNNNNKFYIKNPTTAINWKNPFKLYKNVVTAFPDIKEAIPLKSGDILLVFDEDKIDLVKEKVDKFEEIFGKEASIKAKKKKKNTIVIHGLYVETTKQDIVDELKRQSITSLHIQITTNKFNNKFTTAFVDIENAKTKMDLLKKGYIKLCFQRLKISDFIDKFILQCFKCQRIGHDYKSCKEKYIYCRLCGQNHKSEDCKNKNERRCINCKGKHAASSGLCPIKIMETEKKIKKQMKEKKIKRTTLRSNVSYKEIVMRYNEKRIDKNNNNIYNNLAEEDSAVDNKGGLQVSSDVNKEDKINKINKNNRKINNINNIILKDSNSNRSKRKNNNDALKYKKVINDIKKGKEDKVCIDSDFKGKLSDQIDEFLVKKMCDYEKVLMNHFTKFFEKLFAENFNKTMEKLYKKYNNNLN